MPFLIPAKIKAIELKLKLFIGRSKFAVAPAQLFDLFLLLTK